MCCLLIKKSFKAIFTHILHYPHGKKNEASMVSYNLAATLSHFETYLIFYNANEAIVITYTLETFR